MRTRKAEHLSRILQTNLETNIIVANLTLKHGNDPAREPRSLKQEFGKVCNKNERHTRNEKHGVIYTDAALFKA
jgi:hypothetical protein